MRAIPLPNGIPTYSGAFGYYRWTRPVREIRLLINDFDLFMVQEGQLGLIWPDGERLTVDPGWVALIPPRVSVRVLRLTQPTSYWFCHFSFRRSPGTLLAPLAADYLGPAETVAVPAIFPQKAAPRVVHAYKALTRLKLLPGGRPWQFEAALLRLIGELKHFGWKTGATASPAPVRGDDRVVKVLARIYAEPQRPWTTPDLARDVGISPDRLNVIARRDTHQSVKQLIIDARLQLACRLLQDPSAGRPSVKEVSARCGFASQHYFCRLFRRHFHQTPSDFIDNAIVT